MGIVHRFSCSLEGDEIVFYHYFDDFVRIWSTEVRRIPANEFNKKVYELEEDGQMNLISRKAAYSNMCRRCVYEKNPYYEMPCKFCPENWYWKEEFEE